jgi:hypothetical protein
VPMRFIATHQNAERLQGTFIATRARMDRHREGPPQLTIVG